MREIVLRSPAQWWSMGEEQVNPPGCSERVELDADGQAQRAPAHLCLGVLVRPTSVAHRSAKARDAKPGGGDYASVRVLTPQRSPFRRVGAERSPDRI